MLIVKVSTPWVHINFNQRVSALQPNVTYQFIIDDIKCVECDFWIIWGGIKSISETVVCNPNNIIYLTDEVHEKRFFVKKFVDQFAAILTCRTDLKHKCIIPTHELNTWMIEKDFDEVVSQHVFNKTKEISIVCSDQTWLAGHKLRYAFVNKLMGHFKDKIDVFGRGFNPIQDKYEALAPYKYSIAIENGVLPGYFTEKIADCWLTHTLPLYYGCPNLNQYVDADAYRWLDINHFNSAIATIENIISTNLYNTALPSVINAKNIYLQQLHIFNALPIILDKYFSLSIPKKAITIYTESACEKGYQLNKFLNKALHTLSINKSVHFKIDFLRKSVMAN